MKIIRSPTFWHFREKMYDLLLNLMKRYCNLIYRSYVIYLISSIISYSNYWQNVCINIFIKFEASNWKIDTSDNFMSSDPIRFAIFVRVKQNKNGLWKME